MLESAGRQTHGHAALRVSVVGLTKLTGWIGGWALSLLRPLRGHEKSPSDCPFQGICYHTSEALE